MIFCVSIACVASISVRFEARSEEPESKTARKMGQVKQQGGGRGVIFRAAKTQKSRSSVFLYSERPKPNGNASYAF